MVYWETRFLKISWDESLRCVCTEWKDFFVDGAEYRESLDKVLVLLKSKGASRLLGDGRRMRVISEEDQQWVETSWIPRSAQAGLRCSALLLPKSVLAKMAVGSILTQHKLNDTSSVETVNAYFDDMEKAREWLRRQPG